MLDLLKSLCCQPRIRFGSGAFQLNTSKNLLDYFNSELLCLTR